MRILQLTVNLKQGGAQRLFVDLCNELSKDNEVIVVITHKQARELYHLETELSSDIKIINLGYKGNKLTLPIFFIKFLFLLLRIKPVIIHLHLDVLLYSILPLIFTRKTRFFHTIHGDANRHLIHKKLKWLYRWLYKHKIQAVTISKESNVSYDDLYELNNSELIYNGRKTLQPTKSFNIVSKEIDGYKKDSSTTVFVHPARFVPVKNQELLIKSFNRLLDEHYNVILLIMGEGFDSYEGQKLKSNSKKGVFFLGNKANVGDYLLCSNAFCLTSLSEGMPISLLEALSLGVVPICTPAGGIKNMINDGESGYLSTSFEVDSYYTKLEEFINNPDKINTQRLKEIFNASYSIEICKKKYYNLYNKQC